MAIQYKYEKWGTFYGYELKYESQEWITPLNGEVSGYDSYDLGRFTGEFTVYGGYKTLKTDGVDSGRVYGLYQSKLEERIVRPQYPGGYSSIVYSAEYVEWKSGNYPEEIVTAPLGTYPENGFLEPYWYVLIGLAETATLTYPLGGEVLTGQNTISWTKTNNDVKVNIEYYNGSAWELIGANRVGTSLEYDFSDKPETTKAKIRISTTYGNYAGDWFESGTFSILHNTPPTIPSSITVPILRVNTTAVINWGISTDVDGDAITYQLQRSVNGGSFATVYTGANRSYTEVVGSAWNTVIYRVRAYDGTVYSGFRTSGIFEVRHFPPVKYKKNGQLYTGVQGWTKIDDELKQVTSFNYKIDDELKEV